MHRAAELLTVRGPSRVALLSMDVEDWYHLEYFRGRAERWNGSMLDGLDRFRSLIDEERVPATFFVVGELAAGLRDTLEGLSAAGHEVASHGPDHGLLSSLSTHGFAALMRAHKAQLENVLGRAVRGYRAPCFSIDRAKLECLADLGFDYDSSWIRFAGHPLYGSLDLDDWPTVTDGVHKAPHADFLEFEITTLQRLGRRIPVAGGAYFRFCPWPLMRTLLRPLLARGGIYVFYIHPFECSARKLAAFPSGTSYSTRLRFDFGRTRTLHRIRALIRTLRAAGYQFSTFADLRDAVTA